MIETGHNPNRPDRHRSRTKTLQETRSARAIKLGQPSGDLRARSHHAPRRPAASIQAFDEHVNPKVAKTRPRRGRGRCASGGAQTSAGRPCPLTAVSINALNRTGDTSQERRSFVPYCLRERPGYRTGKVRIALTTGSRSAFDPCSERSAPPVEGSRARLALLCWIRGAVVVLSLQEVAVHEGEIVAPEVKRSLNTAGHCELSGRNLAAVRQLLHDVRLSLPGSPRI
jgi:hypothetical protein